MQINRKKLIHVLNKSGIRNIATPTGTMRFNGDLPESVEIAAFSANTFISEKNKANWIKWVNSHELPEEESEGGEGGSGDSGPTQTLQEATSGAGAEGGSEGGEGGSGDESPVDFNLMSKKELDEYAQKNFGKNLPNRMSKDEMVAECEKLASK